MDQPGNIYTVEVVFNLQVLAWNTIINCSLSSDILTILKTNAQEKHLVSLFKHLT